MSERKREREKEKKKTKNREDEKIVRKIGEKEMVREIDRERIKKL